MTIIGTRQELDLLLETLANSGYCKGIPCEECIFEQENCSKLKNCTLIYTGENTGKDPKKD